MHPLPEFGRRLINALDVHLAAQEEERRAVSLLATGNAFEKWLALEARLLLEGQPEHFCLGDRVELPAPGGMGWQWLQNELSRVDLFVGASLEPTDSDPEPSPHCLAGIEFKLVYNNKNWSDQIDEVWADIFPRNGSTKHQLYPVNGRLAVVGLVGKTFVRHPSKNGWQRDLARWEQDVTAALLAPRKVAGAQGTCSVHNVANGVHHLLRHDELLEGGGSFFRLIALAAG